MTALRNEWGKLAGLAEGSGEQRAGGWRTHEFGGFEVGYERLVQFPVVERARRGRCRRACDRSTNDGRAVVIPTVIRGRGSNLMLTRYTRRRTGCRWSERRVRPSPVSPLTAAHEPGRSPGAGPPVTRPCAVCHIAPIAPAELRGDTVRCVRCYCLKSRGCSLELGVAASTRDGTAVAARTSRAGPRYISEGIVSRSMASPIVAPRSLGFPGSGYLGVRSQRLSSFLTATRQSSASDSYAALGISSASACSRRPRRRVPVPWHQAT